MWSAARARPARDGLLPRHPARRSEKGGGSVIPGVQSRRRIVPGLPAAGRGQRIGLLGGSFNPAHAGHVQISNIARARLGLDQVWWLVSPRNPLKSASGLASLADRVASAHALALPSFIRVTMMEDAIGARYSIETARFLRKSYRGVNFVWLIGADNLVIFERWKQWQELAETFPIAVIDRPGSGLPATASKAAVALQRYRMDESDALALATATPPAWLILHGPLSPLSSTAIRQGL